MAMEKVFFQLVQDEDGYPPVAVESVWAERIFEGLYRIENIPFFTRDATLGDVVQTRTEDGVQWFSSMQVSSTNTLVRVILSDGRDPNETRQVLLELGCDSELSHLQCLFAVNVPAHVPIDSVRAVLDLAAAEGWLEYEEPILRQ
jgi:hypothetical protein